MTLCSQLGSCLRLPVSGDEDDEDDETADGLSIWFVNALGPQARYASRRRTRSDAPPDTRSAATRTTPSLLLTPIAPACAGEERRDGAVRPLHAHQEPLQCARPVAGLRRAHRRVRDLQGLADRAELDRGHAPHGRARPRESSGSRWRGTNTSCRARSTIYATTSSDERRLSRELFTRVSHSMVYRVVEK